jgi:RNA polymerase sigma factor (sigma-70 family)
MESEDLIIKKAAQGREQAFRCLVEKYQSFVIKICLNIVMDSTHAENIAQEIFLQVFPALPSYEYKGFKTWIGKIAFNKAIDYQSTLMDGSSSDLKDFWRNEDYKRVLSLCNNLPEIYKTIINKYYIQEKCYSDIALEERISIKTVESRLYRARKLLREKWEVEDI